MSTFPFKVTHKNFYVGNSGSGVRKTGEAIAAMVNFRGDPVFIVEVVEVNPRGEHTKYECWKCKDVVKGDINTPVEPKPSVENGKAVKKKSKTNKEKVDESSGDGDDQGSEVSSDWGASDE